MTSTSIRETAVKVACWTWIAGSCACVVPEPQPAEWITVPSDAPLETVADSLEAYGIVRSAEAFVRYARIGRKHLGIKPGTYALRPRTPMGEVLMVLREGRPRARVLVVKEGIWLSELAAEVSLALGIAAKDFLEAARDSTLRQRVGARGETLEGYLFPTTYRVPLSNDAFALVRQLVDTFEARWRPEWNARLDTLDITRDELVTLASVIAGEDPLDRDRPLVSSVYHNRLRQGLRLQADPTVVYALQERRRLYNKDYNLESEYNTYRIRGLPPSPIAQPAESSILNALYPAVTDYLYFVARADGRHLFTRTYREHLATIRRIRDSSAAPDR